MRAIIISLLTVLVLAGCVGDESLYELSIRGVSLQVELADTPEVREKGLMERKELPEKTGMLFVFDEPAIQAFWMQNTLIPLSVAYIDSQMVIREIYDMAPLDETAVFSRIEALYALELNQGEFDRYSIRPGDRLVFSEKLRRQLESR